jgi:hypothetical protein
MVRTVREFEKDELREALRRAGKKAVDERWPEEEEQMSEHESEAAESPDLVPLTEEAIADADPSEIKCERVQ